jgi:hypothetical protein
MVKLADLGLAKVHDDERTLSQPGSTFGTPAYMAPEQMRNASAASARSDIYALGATLYHLLTGRKPFAGQTIFELVEAKETGAYEPAQRHNPAVDTGLEQTLRRMMAPDPARRYGDASEVAQTLRETYVGHDGAGADLTPEAIRTATFRKRQWLRFTTASPVRRYAVPVAVLAVLVAPVVTSTRYRAARQLEAQRTLAQAFTLAVSGQTARARTTLINALEDAPGERDLERALGELDKGVLILFQHERDGQADAVRASWSAEQITVRRDDNYRFAVVTSRSCYLYAVQVDGKRSLFHLFPNPAYVKRDNPLSTNETIWIPEERSQRALWLHLDGTLGTERVYFLALTQPLASDRNALDGHLRLASETSRDATLTALTQFLDTAGYQSCFSNGAVAIFEFDHG